ncbi:MAG: helix-turn-helix domain-containing protein [Actinomycetia bacterium]|nr:helix-turn-helix domain-containing protein [Actinomycetes bacterium]
MTRYTYEFEFVEDEEGGYIVHFYDFDTATEGDDMPDAINMAVDLLRLKVEEYILKGKQLPTPRFNRKSKKGGRIVAVSSDLDLRESENFITAKEAARTLKVSAPRVSHLLRDGILHGYREGGNTLITVESVNAYNARHRVPGRPRVAVG